MAASALASLPQDFSPARMTFERHVLSGHPIVEMKLSIGELEIVWLARAQDEYL
ncbi:hypothetical protein PO002_08150 [Cupriavidus necator]|uniref:hypothetical protein n=1 Tax=Cupriavidus necator TaxID=106590 RepID=UPI0039C2171B